MSESLLAQKLQALKPLRQRQRKTQCRFRRCEDYQESAQHQNPHGELNHGCKYQEEAVARPPKYHRP